MRCVAVRLFIHGAPALNAWRALGAAIVAARWPVLLVVAALFGGSILVLPRVQPSMSISPLIEGRDSGTREIESLAERLPPRYFNFLGILTWPRPIAAAELAKLDELGEFLKGDDRVWTVRSLASVPVVEPGRLLPRSFAQVVGSGTAAEVAKRQPLLHRRLLSADGRSAAILINSYYGDDAERKARFLGWLEKVVPEQLGADVGVRFISGFVAERARRAYMKEDVTLIIVLELLVAVFLLPFVFRSVRGVLLPVLGMMGALLANGGLLAVTVAKLEIIELAIPGLILMIALSDAVHMMHRFEEALAEGLGRAAAIAQMTQRVGVACFITSVTTAIGFLSLLIADHAAVRAFGVKAAVAVMVTFVVTMVVLPLGLAFLPVRRPALPRFPGLESLGYGRAKLILAVFAGLMVFAGVGISRVQVDARWLEELPDRDPIKADLAYLEEQFAGILTLEAAVTGDLASAPALQELERFQQRMLEFSAVIRAESVTQWLRTATGRFDEPIDAKLVRNGRARLQGIGRKHSEHIVNRDYSVGKCIFSIENTGAKRILEIRDAMVRLGREVAPSLKISATGYGLMAYEAAQNVAQNLLESLLITAITITILIGFIYRSLPLALISILPNLAPIFIALGVNGWLDIPLRVGIVMIYSLGLGLAVDDTIHLLTRLQQERRKNRYAPLRGPILRSLRTAGAALVVTSVLLVAGALCFVPANFQSVHDAGILIATIVVSALFADLFVLPLLLERFLRPKTSKPISAPSESARTS